MPENTAAIVGVAEYPAHKMSNPVLGTGLEQAADLALLALDDAGLSLSDVDGLAVKGIHESSSFVPATVAEYLGRTICWADAPDLGGASSAAMVGRAAMAIRHGLASVVLCLVPGSYAPPEEGNGIDWRFFGASSYKAGSPQAEFEIPYGHVGQNVPYAFIAQRYGHQYGYDPAAMARLVVQQRQNACSNPAAIFHGQSLTVADVLGSRMIAPPLRMLEIVRPVSGGAAVVVARADIARRLRHRPVCVRGYGEAVASKSPQFAADMMDPPLRQAAAIAFAMAGLRADDIQAAQIYDCYTIAVLMGLEAAGFCKAGEGMAFLDRHDLTFHGDFPLNTNGGQLGFGQAAGAGGMTHVVEAVRQASQRAGERQVEKCDIVFVSGNGGIMSEQVALILEGADI